MHLRPRYSLLTLLVVMALVAGGVKLWRGLDPLGPEGELMIRDGTGTVIATGKLRLPITVPAVGQHFDGKWSLDFSSPPFPTHATQSGKYSEYTFAGGVSCDLAPGMQDNNVVLKGTMHGQVFFGDWSHATIAGDKAIGTFVITWPAGCSH